MARKASENLDFYRQQLQEIEMKGNQRTDESLESTRRMIQMLEVSREAGLQTFDALDHQKEKLNKVEDGLGKIEDDTGATQKDLTEMEKCCGLCVCPCQKGRRSRQNSESWKGSDSPKSGSSNAVTTGPRKKSRKWSEELVHMPSSDTTKLKMHRITNDAREDEMEENIQNVDVYVSQLKKMAVDLGQDLDEENKQLDSMIHKTNQNESNLSQATQRATKLL